MPKCSNCKTKKYYRGFEKSPTGKGICGMCEIQNSQGSGKDRKKWVVLKRKTGKYWKRLSSKSSKSSKKKKVLSQNELPLSKDMRIYVLSYMDINSILNTCNMNADFARFCLKNQSLILQKYFNDNDLFAKNYYSKWKKLVETGNVVIRKKYHTIEFKKIKNKILVYINPPAPKQIRLDSKHREFLKIKHRIVDSGLKRSSNSKWVLDKIVPRFHFNIILENLKKI